MEFIAAYLHSDCFYFNLLFLQLWHCAKTNQHFSSHLSFLSRWLSQCCLLCLLESRGSSQMTAPSLMLSTFLRKNRGFLSLIFICVFSATKTSSSCKKRKKKPKQLFKRVCFSQFISQVKQQLNSPLVQQKCVTWTYYHVLIIYLFH